MKPSLRSCRKFPKQKPQISSMSILFFLFIFMIIFSPTLVYSNTDEANKKMQTQALLEQLYERNKELDDENKVYEKKMLDFVAQVTEKEKQVEALGKKLAAAMDEMKLLKSKEEKADAGLTIIEKNNEQTKEKDLELEKLKSEAKKASEELAIIQQAQEATRKEKEELQKKLDVIQAEREALAKSNDTAKQSLESILKEKERLVEENSQIHKKLDLIQGEQEGLSKTNDTAKQSLESVLKEKERLIEENLEIHKKLDAIQGEKEGLTRSSESVQQTLDAVLKEKEALVGQNAEIQKKLDQVEKLQKTIEDLKRERELIMTQTSQIQQRLGEAEDEKKSAIAEKDNLLKQAESAKKAETSLAQERDQLLKKNEQMQKSLNDLDKEKKDALQERDDLKREMENLKKKTDEMLKNDKSAQSEALKEDQGSLAAMQLRAVALEKKLIEREDEIKKLESAQKNNLDKIERIEQEKTRTENVDHNPHRLAGALNDSEIAEPAESSEPEAVNKTEGAERKNFETLSKTVRHPLSDRVSPWKNPGFRDAMTDVTAEDNIAEESTEPMDALDPSSLVSKTREEDTQYEIKILREKAKKLESKLDKRDAQLQNLNQEIDGRIQKMQEEKESLEAIMVELKRELQDVQIKHSAAEVKRDLMRPQHKPSAHDSQTRPENSKIAYLEKKTEGLRKRAIQDRENYFYNLGVMLMRLGNFKQAARMLEKAVDLDPTDTSAHYNLGILYDDHLDEPRQAIRHYQAFLDLSHDTEKVRDVAKWLQMTESYAGTGGRKSRVQSAREAFEHLFLTNSY